MPLILYVATGIAVLTSIWTTLLAVRVLFHLSSWEDRISVAETKAQRVEGKLNAHDRHDRDAIRDAVDQYLAQIDAAPQSSGDDLGAMMQMFAMMQGQTQPQPQPEPEPHRQPQHSNGRVPGIIGRGGVDTEPDNA